MEIDKVPQDQDNGLGINLKVLKYAVDQDGKYARVQSTGWEAENTVLSMAWDEIETKIEAVRQQVLKGEASPLAYYLERNQMDISILSDYTGFWKFTVKRHLKPFFFNRLSEKTLRKYAIIFQIEVSDLKQIPAN